CIAQAASALASNAMVAATCPRADLGVIDGGAMCQEAPLPGELDPAKLRCGGSSDDLAVALGSLTPADAWLTRETMQIPDGKLGADWILDLPGGGSVSPVRVASAVDVGSCGGTSSSSSSSSSSSTSSSTGSS